MYEGFIDENHEDNNEENELYSLVICFPQITQISKIFFCVLSALSGEI